MGGFPLVGGRPNAIDHFLAAHFALGQKQTTHPRPKSTVGGVTVRFKMKEAASRVSPSTEGL
jgi:hypothetical protein